MTQYEKHVKEFDSTIPSLRPTFIAPSALCIANSTGSYGKYVIRLSNTTFRFFWKKTEAVAFLKEAKGATNVER